MRAIVTTATIVMISFILMGFPRGAVAAQNIQEELSPKYVCDKGGVFHTEDEKKIIVTRVGEAKIKVNSDDDTRVNGWAIEFIYNDSTFFAQGAGRSFMNFVKHEDILDGGATWDAEPNIFGKDDFFVFRNPNNPDNPLAFYFHECR